MRKQIALINRSLEKTVFGEQCKDLREVEKCIVESINVNTDNKLLSKMITSNRKGKKDS